MTIGNAVAIQNVIDEKQDVLVSGTTIKTINGTSVLGSGDIVISGGSGGVDSVNGQTGVVVLTKSDISLSNVDDTSDTNKPISTATQTALDLKANLDSPTFTGTVSGDSFNLITGLSNTNPLVDGIAAIGTSTLVSRQDHIHPSDTTKANDSSVVHLSGNETITGIKTFDAQPVGILKDSIGLSNVDNTSDANKPVSTAQQTALDLKSNLSGGNTFSGNQICSTTTLSYSSTIDLDLSLNANFEITLTGNIAFSNPSTTTPVKGQIGTITITQDGTGGRTIAWGTNFKFEGGTAQTYVTTANSVSTFIYFVRSSTTIIVVPILDWK